MITALLRVDRNYSIYIYTCGISIKSLVCGGGKILSGKG